MGQLHAANRDIGNGVGVKHYGIKGMHWGVRKDSSSGGASKPAKPEIKRATDSIAVKLNNGKTLHMSGDKTPALARFIARMSPGFRKNVNNASNYTLKDENGKRVGEMSLFKESKTSLNVVWVGVDKSHRGQGYASAAMRAAVDLAKKQKLDTVTLEVPGNSPDARHIYEKMGFKEDPSKSTHDDPVWGGLTAMELNLKTVKHDAMVHYGVKGMHWGVRKANSSGGGSAPAPKPAPKPRMSEDAKNVERAFSKINRGGTDALSNQELQHLVNRLNLEQNYNRLTSEPSAQQAHAISRGHDMVKTALSFGKTYNEVQKFLNSDGGKLLKKGFKVASAGVKVGAAAYTGGASGAAAAGASLVVRRMSNHYTNVGK